MRWAPLRLIDVLDLQRRQEDCHILQHWCLLEHLRQEWVSTAIENQPKLKLQEVNQIPPPSRDTSAPASKILAIMDLLLSLLAAACNAVPIAAFRGLVCLGGRLFAED
jgi:hypothetical protein